MYIYNNKYCSYTKFTSNLLLLLLITFTFRFFRHGIFHIASLLPFGASHNFVAVAPRDFFYFTNCSCEWTGLIE